METAQASSSHELARQNRSEWPRWAWEKVGMVLAIIGLADLFGQLIKWASAIHWVIDHYRIARIWLFGWLPFHIPPEWHDPIILIFIVFSVVNIGLYRRTGRTYFTYLPLTIWQYLQEDRGYRGLYILILGFVWALPALYFPDVGLMFLVELAAIIAVTLFVIGAILSGAIIAWRWILTTGTIFLVLLAVNAIYVRLLDPIPGN
jgi:hypothetical protein